MSSLGDPIPSSSSSTSPPSQALELNPLKMLSSLATPAAASSSRNASLASDSSIASTSRSSSTPSSSPSPTPPPPLVQLQAAAVDLATAFTEEDAQPAAEVEGSGGPTGAGAGGTAGDAQLVEALSGKDRLYVLRIGEMMDVLVGDPSHPPLTFSPPTSFQRLIVYRCAQYLGLLTSQEGASGKVIQVRGVASSLPPRRIIDIVPAALPAPTPQAFKLMRRDPSTNNSSRHGSENGDAEDGSSSRGGGGRKKKSYEERQADYEEARLRIFSPGASEEDSASGSGDRTRGDTATPSSSVLLEEDERKSRSRTSSSSSNESVPVVFIDPSSSSSSSSVPQPLSSSSSLPLRPSAPEFDPSGVSTSASSSSLTKNSLPNRPITSTAGPSSSSSYSRHPPLQSRLPLVPNGPQSVRGPPSSSSSSSSYQQNRGASSYQQQQRSTYDPNSRSSHPQQQQQQQGWSNGNASNIAFPQLPTQPFIPQPHQLAFVPSPNYNQPPQAYVFVPTVPFDTGQQQQLFGTFAGGRGAPQQYPQPFVGSSPQHQHQQPVFNGVNANVGPSHSYPPTPQQGPVLLSFHSYSNSQQTQQGANWSGSQAGSSSNSGHSQHPQQQQQQFFGHGRPDGTNSAPPFPHHSNSFPPSSSSHSSTSSNNHYPTQTNHQGSYAQSSHSSSSYNSHPTTFSSPQPHRFPTAPSSSGGGIYPGSSSIYTQHRSDSSVSSSNHGGDVLSRPVSRGSSSSGRMSFGERTGRQQGWNASGGGRSGGWVAGVAGSVSGSGSGTPGSGSGVGRERRPSSPSSTTSSASRLASQLAHIPPPKDHPLPPRPDWSVGNQQFDLRRPDPPSISSTGSIPSLPLTNTDFPPLAGDHRHSSSSARRRASEATSSRPPQPGGVIRLGEASPFAPSPATGAVPSVWQPGMGRAIVMRGVAKPSPVTSPTLATTTPTMKILSSLPPPPPPPPSSPPAPISPAIPSLPPAPPSSTQAPVAMEEDDFEPRQPIPNPKAALFDPSSPSSKAAQAPTSPSAGIEARLAGVSLEAKEKVVLSYSSVLRRT